MDDLISASSLHCLTSEQWGLITILISSDDIFRLVQCGDIQLTRTLQQRGAVRSIRNNLLLYCPKTLLKTFNYLESYTWNRRSIRNEGISSDLEFLSPTLRRLVVWNLSQHFQQAWRSDGVVTAMKRFKNLESYETNMDITLSEKPWPEDVEEMFPPHLGLLQFYKVFSIFKMPPTLHTLRCEHLTLQDLLESPFPPSMTSLECEISTSLQSWMANQLSVLPPTLLSLTLSTDSSQILDATLQLPQTLTYLDLSLCGSTGSQMTSWPPNLTFLSWPNLHPTGLALLPKQLTSLCIITDRMLGPSVPYSTEQVLEGISKLSPLITSLSLPYTLANWAVPMEQEYDSADHLSQDRVQLSLPPSLTKLDWTRLPILQKARKYLPTTVTELKVGSLTWPHVEWIRDLRITSLHIGAFPLTSAAIKCLPQTLISLVADSDRPLFRALGTATSEDESQEASTAKFPPNLTFTSIHGRLYQENQLIYALPKQLVQLSLGFSPELSNSAIRLLPRFLTSFTVQYAKLITGDCFQDLPRTLTYLTIEGCTEVSRVQLMDLPRHLKSLHMHDIELGTGPEETDDESQEDSEDDAEEEEEDEDDDSWSEGPIMSNPLGDTLRCYLPASLTSLSLLNVVLNDYNPEMLPRLLTQMAGTSAVFSDGRVTDGQWYPL